MNRKDPIGYWITIGVGITVIVVLLCGLSCLIFESLVRMVS